MILGQTSLLILAVSWCSIDAHKAVQLLEEYRKKLEGAENEQLREALEKAIVAIRSRLFQALLGDLHSQVYMHVQYAIHIVTYIGIIKYE